MIFQLKQRVFSSIFTYLEEYNKSMFGNKNKSQGNTFKSTPIPPKEKVVKKEKSTASKNISLNKVTNPIYSFLENERNRYILGLAFIMLTAFLSLSFISYFFTWEFDQDKVENWSTTGFEVFNDNFSYEKEPKNKMGTIGAKLSHMLMHKGFGIAAFGIPFILFIAGLKFSFKKNILPLKKSFKITLIIMLWLATFFGLILKNSEFNYGGALGSQVNIWLDHIAGTWGIIFILLFFLFIISRFTFNIKIDELIQSFFNNQGKSLENEVASENSFINPQKSFKTIHPVPDIEIQETSEIDKSAEEVENQEIEITEKLGFDLNITSTISEKVESPEEPSINLHLEIENTIEDETPTLTSKTEVGIREDLSNKKNIQELTYDTEESVIELGANKEVPEQQPKGNEEISFEVEETTQKEELLTEKEINEKVKEFGEYDPTLDLGSYQFPKVELLNKYDAGVKQVVDPAILERNKNNIVQTLKNYKIEIDSIKATIGPTITLYEIIPAPGVRISKIKNLEDDIALSLAALGIRIIAPIPGKGTVGIEVPNPNPDIVSMHTAISSKAFQEAEMELPLALGKTITNETYTIDLAKMPHLLMAGATGQGKSVGLNAILVSLLYRKHPSELKLVLVDPKKVELTLFNKVVRHFLAKLPGEDEAIITDTQKVVNTVNSLCVEMDERYELLKNAHCRNIKEYNVKFKKRKLNPEKGHKFLPYIVLVIDEFADLIMTAGKEIETPIARLAQLARAIGIHLIVATQRPSVNIITGTIKANFPCRIAFRVTSKIDSRTILDAGGADQLIGRGDMLLSTGNDLIRIQCAFVDTPEVEQICEFIGEQRGYSDAHLLPEFNDPNADSGSTDVHLDDRDDKFEEAARIIVLHQQGSASLLQRKLKLGYNRAGRIVDQLEAAGIIGQFEGSKARQVLIPDEVSLEQKLINLNNKTI